MRRLPSQLLAALVAGSLAVAVGPAGAQSSDLSPSGLRVEYAENPLGIDATAPRLSWRSTSTARGALQTAYRIQAAASEEDLAAERLLWDSGRVASADSLFVRYGGPALRSREPSSPPASRRPTSSA